MVISNKEWVEKMCKMARVNTCIRRGKSSVFCRAVSRALWFLKKQLRGPRTQPPSKTSRTASRRISSSPAVNVCYVLVVLDVEGGHTNQWKFPTGWNEKCKMNDHRGKVYCLEVSLAASPSLV